jgi:GrpE
VAEARREEERVIPIKTGGEEPSAEPGSLSSDPTAPAGIDPATDTVLSAELAKLRAEKEDLLNTLVRRQADFENFRKRVERERHEEGRRGVERLILDLIPVLDAFDRALKTHDEPGFRGRGQDVRPAHAPGGRTRRGGELSRRFHSGSISGWIPFSRPGSEAGDRPSGRSLRCRSTFKPTQFRKLGRLIQRAQPAEA